MATSMPKHTDEVDTVLLRWAQEWLDEAVQNERVDELPYCVSALEHLRLQQAGQSKAVAVGTGPKRRRPHRTTAETAIAA